MFRIKRVYEAASQADGRRVLVDRLWPRGVSKARAALDDWRREIAPSTALRSWFGHDPARWDEFQRRYRLELRGERRPELEALAQEGGRQTVTLLYGARDEAHNEAVVLLHELERLSSRPVVRSPRGRPTTQSPVQRRGRGSSGSPAHAPRAG